MKAMIWKELREQGKWAILVALGLGVLCFCLAWDHEANRANDYTLMHSLLSWTVVAAPLFGMVLSLLQIVPELKRDQWAFLLHRPATRGTLFFGKVIAGLGLYFAALGIPFSCVVAWLAIPGHVAAPFVPELALPGVADILMGTVFYFAGMLTALRSARWYGTRLIGVVTALVCLGIVISAIEFWQALLAIALSAAVMLAAAYGAFLASGEYGSQPRLSRFSLAVVCFAGAFVALWAGILFIISQHENTNAPTVWRDYEVDKNGRILQVARKGSSILDVSTLDGKPAPNDGISDQNSRSVSFSALLEKNWGYRFAYRNDNRYFSSMGARMDVALFRVFPTGRLVAYSKRAGGLIGSLGPDGFSKTLSGAGFSEAEQGIYARTYDQFSDVTVFMQTAGAVYGVDPDHLQVTRLFTVTAPDHLRGVCQPTLLGDIPAHPAIPVIVLTDNRITALSQSGTPLFTTPVAFDTSIYQRITVAMLPGGGRYYFWYYPGFKDDRLLADTEYVVETDAAGKELARHALPPLANTFTALSTDFRWLSVAIPPALFAVLSGYATVRRNAPYDPLVQIYHAVAHAQNLAICCFCGLIAAILAYLLGTRYGWDRRGRLAWAFGIFWLGIPGLLMLVALQPLPVREICPACGRKRVITRQTCEHCGAAWPTPQRNGTEIFELEAAA